MYSNTLVPLLKSPLTITAVHSFDKPFFSCLGAVHASSPKSASLASLFHRLPSSAHPIQALVAHPISSRPLFSISASSAFTCNRPIWLSSGHLHDYFRKLQLFIVCSEFVGRQINRRSKQGTCTLPSSPSTLLSLSLSLSISFVR
jgi:hypothetical protein